MLAWVKRRLTKELHDVEYEINESERVVNMHYLNKDIRVLIPPNYPFIPPKIYINDRRLSYNPANFPHRLWNTYSKHHQCQCCSNSLCANNWSPARTIIPCIDEYYKFVKTLKIYHNFYLFKDSLPHDMLYEIFSFL